MKKIIDLILFHFSGNLEVFDYIVSVFIQDCSASCSLTNSLQ